MSVESNNNDNNNGDNDQNTIGKYLISYKINNNGNSTGIIRIVFKEVETEDGRFGVTEINSVPVPSFTCLCPPGKPFYLSNFKTILAKSTLIEGIREDNIKGVATKTRDKDTKQEKKVAGFSNMKGSIDDGTDLLKENEESNKTNFFEVLTSSTEKVYLDINVPKDSLGEKSKNKYHITLL